MKLKELINTPNTITLLRFLLIPLFIIFLIRNETIESTMVFIILLLGDCVDGISARLLKQQTRFGELFDSVTDNTLLISTLITLIIIKKYLPLTVIILFLIPSTIICISKIIYIKKTKDLSPTLIGKITTISAYITGIMYLINISYKEDLLIVTLLLSYSTMTYFIYRIYNSFYSIRFEKEK